MQEPKQIFSQTITKAEMIEINDKLRAEIEDLKDQYRIISRIRDQLSNDNAGNSRELKRTRG